MRSDTMAEFCFDCFKEMMETEDAQWRYVLSNELELCEGCAQHKKVVVKEKLLSRLQKRCSPNGKRKKNENLYAFLLGCYYCKRSAGDAVPTYVTEDEVLYGITVKS